MREINDKKLRNRWEIERYWSDEKEKNLKEIKRIKKNVKQIDQEGPHYYVFQQRFLKFLVERLFLTIFHFYLKDEEDEENEQNIDPIDDAFVRNIPILNKFYYYQKIS